MNVLDWILLAIRWGHALAAVAWVGGGIFYLMVLRPAIQKARGLPPGTNQAIGVEFRGLVGTAIAVLLLTGVILSVSRLTEEAVTPREVFDLRREKPKTRERYGRRTIGQSCLLARRLVEGGSRVVVVRDRNWDHHANIRSVLAGGFFPKLNRFAD